MRILILANPKSGRARGLTLAQAALDALRADGHAVELFTANFVAQPDAFAQSLKNADLLILSGGDGTVHKAAPIAALHKVPVRHLPAGTENLFARSWGTTADPAAIVADVRAWRVVQTDIGLCNGAPFILMCSAGPDASITATVDRRRSAPAAAQAHAMYIAPIALELLRPAIPRITIDADGVRILTDAPGLAVVANSPCYAMRMNPARTADPTDGLLDLAFMPARTAWGIVGWAMACLRGDQADDPRFIRARARDFTLTINAPRPCVQADGEPLPLPASTTLRLCISPTPLRVLIPGAH